MLVDKFGRIHTYLRISLSERCNLRCSYCMPKEGVKLSPNTDLMTTEEVLKLSEFFVKKCGITKIRLTGGEPTLNKDLTLIIKKLNELKKYGLENIALTSNGIILYRYLYELKLNGLNSVNISLDTLDEQNYFKITNSYGVKNVLKSLSVALALNFNETKLNCVLMKNVNMEELVKFIELTKDLNITVRFIEFMPFGGNKWNADQYIPYIEAFKMIQNTFKSIKKFDQSSATTSCLYQVEGCVGKFGFISSISENFCSTCNRLRISATGNLQMCLFGGKTMSMRDLIRSGISDDDLYSLLQAQIKHKKFKHNGYDLTLNQNGTDIPMILIGG